MIVIGLGTGRCGTASLAMLLNAQRDAICFHEMIPSAVRFRGTPRPILNAIDEFQAIIDGGDSAMVTVDLSRAVSAETYDRLRTMGRVRHIGDIALYYLSYVEPIANYNANVRFVCLRRDREETVDSWMRYTLVERSRAHRLADRLSSLITREPYFESRNFWMEHDGKKWLKDAVWDKCFPKFDTRTKRDALYQYWDYYYEAAAKILERWPERFRIFDTGRLSEDQGQREILDFCGISQPNQVLANVHINRS